MAPAPHRAHGFLDYQLTEVLGPLVKRADLFGSGPFNFGDSFNYRVPDQGYHRDQTPPGTGRG